MMKLQGRSAIITGASQGLGKAIALRFVQEGANVCICARDGALCEAVAAELQSLAPSGQKVIARPADVSREDLAAALLTDAVQAFGRLEILVNNAGVYGPKGHTDEVDLGAWIQAVEINLYGTLIPSREAIRHFKANSGYGKIINLSGGGATAPLPRLSAYAASKAAVVRLTETLAEELREYRVDVNAVAPGALNTRLLDEVLAAGPERVGKEFYRKAIQQRDSGGVPLERGAQLCVYLASAESDGITGKLISAQWDPWERLHEHREQLSSSDIFTLRRIVPADRHTAL
ncbi:MAG: SDR family NAD(P)-dependent oxidoreductase [Verrucomicrobia bacterium]|nr:SDR family NAD(P)-dependent oxidoreductase [Verrucomicrobiota bacterium]